MCCDELVDRACTGDEDRHACLAAATRTAHLLPGRRDRPRIAGQDCGVKTPDIDAQLERVGAHDAEHVTATQSSLDVASLSGQVAAAVAADALERPAAFAE